MRLNNILFETELLKISHEYEVAFITDRSGFILFKENFYGDPSCGLISKSNDWAVIGGDHLAIWNKTGVKKIYDNDLRWIHSLRLKSENVIEILIDPWSAKSAIWELDIDTMLYLKVRDFNGYKNQQYTDDVEW